MLPTTQEYYTEDIIALLNDLFSKVPIIAKDFHITSSWIFNKKNISFIFQNHEQS